MSSEQQLDDWVENTTAFDRVHDVATTVQNPQPAADIADEAHVAENTARKHLKRLEQLNAVIAKTDGRGEKYKPDPLYTRMKTLRKLLDNNTKEELLNKKMNLLENVEDWENEHETTNPSELRKRASDTETVEETRTLKQTASEWEHTVLRISVIEDAIEYYDAYNI